MAKGADDGNKLIASNKKAYHDFEVLEKIEAGIVLVGTEVKSMRQQNGAVAFTDAYARVKQGECWLIDLHIAPYSNAVLDGQHAPTRPRKLLLHSREIRKLAEKMDRQGLTIVPLSLYFKRGMVKVELGVAKGKKLYDKRESLRKKEDQRSMAREGRRDR